MRHRFRRTIGLICVLMGAASGCALTGYRHAEHEVLKLEPPGHDRQALTPAQTQPRTDVLYYRVYDGPWHAFWGPKGVRQTLSSEAGITTERRSEPPDKGVFVGVHTSEYRGNPAALTWLYVTCSATLCALPAFYGSGGFSVRYQVHIDGKPLREYRYKVKRWVFAWLPILPLSWISAATPSARKRFGQTVQMFVDDARRDGILQ